MYTGNTCCTSITDMIMPAELPIAFRTAFDTLLESLGDRADYGGFQVRQLDTVIRNPSVLPQLDRRLAVLTALVLGGRAEEALALGSELFDGSEADATWVPIVATAATECGKHAAVLPYLQLMEQLQGAGMVELLTALACTTADEERYSEAADYLDMTQRLPAAPSMLAPLGILQRLRLWVMCRARCHMPVFDSDTGKLELPEQLRERCLAGVEAELARLNAVVPGPDYLRLALALTVTRWCDAELGEQLTADADLRARVDRFVESLLHASADAGEQDQVT